MNIVLTGMRGSGKSYQGRRLASLLGWKFVDTDDLIVQKADSTISEIVEQHGWPKFCKLEHEICEEVSAFDEHVISTGGGLIIDRKNEQLLRENDLPRWSSDNSICWYFGIAVEWVFFCGPNDVGIQYLL